MEGGTTIRLVPLCIYKLKGVYSIVFLKSVSRQNGIDFYICKKITGKTQYLKKLGKIPKAEAEQKLAEYKPKYEKIRYSDFV